MDQNQTITNPAVDDDLQKAIDNITNTTNIDPVFSDPVAAPSSVPEGDTGELDEPVGPFPVPKIEMRVPTPESIAPLEAMAGVPDLVAPAPMPEVEQMPAPAPEEVAPAPEEIAPVPEPIPAPEPIAPADFIATENLNMHQVKEAALRDLVPLLEHLKINASQKFRIYRDIFETLKDYTVLSRAYNAAKEILDDTERAEALLYIIESIDRM